MPALLRTVSLLCALAFLGIAASPAEGAEPKPPREAKAKETKPKPEPLGESLCPATMSVEQRATAVPEGWEATQSGTKPQIAVVTFFDGPPAERASLKYDSEQKEKREWVATWNLRPNSRGYWIQCGYDSTTAVLSRRLPESVTTCRVIYERREWVAASGLPAVRHVSCR